MFLVLFFVPIVISIIFKQIVSDTSLLGKFYTSKYWTLICDCLPLPTQPASLIYLLGQELIIPETQEKPAQKPVTSFSSSQERGIPEKTKWTINKTIPSWTVPLSLTYCHHCQKHKKELSDKISSLRPQPFPSSSWTS
jgi:hypothetical protein